MWNHEALINEINKQTRDSMKKGGWWEGERKKETQKKDEKKR
jgi:hypothetical protein